MGYSSGMLNKRITIARRKDDAAESFGKKDKPKYEILGTYWASETFDKGVKSLREGAFDAYNTVMFRMRYYKGVDRWCLIQYNGKWYQIQSFNESYQDNQIQITAIELANQQVNIVEPTPEPEPTPTPTPDPEPTPTPDPEQTPEPAENDNNNEQA